MEEEPEGGSASASVTTESPVTEVGTSARSARRAARGPDACAEAAATRDTSSATTSAHLWRAFLAHMPSKPRRRALAAKYEGPTDRPTDRHTFGTADEKSRCSKVKTSNLRRVFWGAVGAFDSRVVCGGAPKYAFVT